ncbi:phage head morphogenesis protein [Acinetobacter baumannii]|uniref:phage head morphogenesis protein n=1 Tax=Acinetobacter baumannii TaxID=470 RepID=UPI000DE676B4|nr:phage minor head protein [Acinetobacter baumannii]MDC3808474.1 phage head morphogenesis protein [Acinetobacter baumannii]MDC4004341.1 phage head morphogenesis protein [Acinetobacter baumannii]MDC4053968.1 phage head morphogenesis protein [Acinetobacter baumannii]MDC4140159.1 phage head morphogenesis protein [Acinetobacter baumannii]MDC4159844.1 phage head morphogenesis protein [Acinetobacter baumannii]
MPTAQRPELNALFNLPPKDAISYLEEKGFKIGWDWHETLDNAHSKAFTVAKIARMDLLQDIRQSLITAMEKGQTLEQWKASITPTLQEKGWWGKKTVINPEGREQEVQLGSPRRLRTIYDTNMQSAFAAGRYKAMLAGAETRPFWEWRHITISNPRKQHVALNGRLFRFDDPFWNVAYPPSEWGCKCRVIARSAREVEGKEILSGEGNESDIYERVGVDRNTGADVIVKRTQFDIPTKDGKLTFAPAAGFNGSPASSYLLNDVMINRATNLLGEARGLNQSQKLMTNQNLTKVNESFVNHALKLSKSQKQFSPIGVLQYDSVKFLTAAGQSFESKMIWLSDEVLVNKKYTDVSVTELIALPDLIANVEQKLWDKQTQALFYVLPHNVVVEFKVVSGHLQVSRIFKNMPPNDFEVIE